MLNIYLHKCKNTTENNNRCYDKETIDENLSNSIITFMFPDFDVNNDLIDYPFQYKLYSDTYSLSPKMTVEMILSKKEVYYYTDHGLVFENQIVNHGFKHDSFIMKYDIINENKEERSYFLNIMIILSGKKEVYSRKFLKLEEAIASLGGIIKVVQVISQLLLYFVTEQFYFLKLINKIFILDNNSISNNKNRFLNLRETFLKDLKDNINNSSGEGKLYQIICFFSFFNICNIFFFKFILLFNLF